MPLTRRALPALLIAAIVVSCGARAAPLTPTPPRPEGKTLGAYVYGGGIYNSNPFLISNDTVARNRLGTTDTGDFITRAGGGLQMTWPIGLQMLHFDGWIERNKYQNFTSLDHTAFDANLGWDWEIGRLWSGTVETGYSRGIASFQEFRALDKNVTTRQVTSADAGLRFLPDWEWVLGAHRRSTSFDKRSDLDRVESTGFTEVHYNSAVNTRMGLRAEITRGDLNRDERLADGTVLGNDYIETQYSVVLGVEGSEELSYLTGRFGFTQRKFDDRPERDFSGPTAHLSYLWKVTANTGLRLSAWRELQAQNNEIANYLISQGYSLEPIWQATVKIRVRGHYSFQNRDYQGRETPGNLNAGREDDLHTIGLGIDYQALPNLYLSLEAKHQSRDSNREIRNFDYEQISAGVTYEFF
ncbi:outer membrane beta-barrel protein [Nitrococcus mobilis]|nr:outer membrane beta-barrel protein [Nitrococcus mobilis]